MRLMKVTVESAKATLKYNVAIKCATATPDETRVKEFGLMSMWRSPNGTIRNILNDTGFREPILCCNIPRIVPGWKKPICIGRHAFGDQYCVLLIQSLRGLESLKWFSTQKMVLAQWNLMSIILMAQELRLLCLTLMRFMDIFQEVYEEKWTQKFEEHSIWYEHRLIDDRWLML